MHLSRLPHQLCILSVLLHLNYGKHEVITDSILAEHHQDLAFALDQFKASGSFTAIQSIAIPYLDIDVSVGNQPRNMYLHVFVPTILT
jgi:hypothetical protein